MLALDNIFVVDADINIFKNKERETTAIFKNEKFF